MNPNNCPLNSVETAIAFSSKDWSINNRDAWVYGVTLGWDDAALVELKELHGWSSETVSRLKTLHNDWEELKK